ncbi:MAG: site-specific DNA-methyltransferase [Candidatus Eisenbacteria sp.]|nr:site-specific DNA-methyltransferase [Candidatus Eisenbacteria bacterium]
MEKLDPKADGATTDIVGQNIEKLKALFPDVFTEGRVDLDALRETLGEYADDRQERYSFTWNGKARARRIAQTPSTGTLRPCPEESVNWDTTKNLFVEGDNMEVLKLFQKSYHKKVKMIYIDPPYNTGGDFIYPDDFRDNIKNYMELTGQTDEEGRKLTVNAETSGRYHTNWLNMMYPRLKLARNLLRDDGAIFISIDDHEAHNLRHVCNEIFGEENFKADIAWQKRYTRSNNTVDFTTVVEHLIVYAKSEAFMVNLLPRTEEADARYGNPDNDLRGPWKGASFLNPATPDQRPNLCYPIENPNTKHVTETTTHAWRRSREEYERLLADNRLYWGSDGTQAVPSIKMFLSDARGLTPVNFWPHDYAGNTDDGTRDLRALIAEKVFDNPKPVLMIRRAIEHSCAADSIILDFFAGSCTAAQAVLEMNVEDGGTRRFLMVQIQEPCDKKSAAYKAGFKTIADVGKERIRRVIQKIEADRDMKVAEAELALPGMDDEAHDHDLDLGVKVFKLDSSNIRPWDPDFENLQETLLNAVDNIKSDRSEGDVLYELLVKYGLDLAVPIEERKIDGKMVCIIGAGALVVCLADGVTLDLVEGIAALKAELAPEIMRVIFKDAGFKEDVVKTNAVQILRQAGIEAMKSL